MDIVTAYFDTNVYGHIARRVCVDDEAVAALTAAADAGRIRILVSTDDIDETALGFASDPVQATEKLRVLVQLTDLERNVLRPLDELLETGMRACAERKALPNRTVVDAATGGRVAARVAGWIASGNVAPEYQPALDLFRTARDEFASGLQAATPEIIAVWKGTQQRIKADTGTTMRQMPFKQYRGPISSRFIDAMVKSRGLKKGCKGRMSDLRGIKALNAYGELSAADLRHAAIATAADVFVTCDDQLLRLAQRAAIHSDVVDLPEFIKKYVRGERAGSEE
jgi:hypothetical protein